MVFIPHLQVPGLFDHVAAFDKCTDGVAYSLLLTVPTLYIAAAILFGCLGVVIHWWDRRQEAKSSSYSTFTNEAETDSEAEVKVLNSTTT